MKRFFVRLQWAWLLAGCLGRALTGVPKAVVLAVIVMLLGGGSAAGKDNFSMSGSLVGLDKDDVLLIEYVTFEPDRKVVRKRVPVREGRFEFSTSLKNAWLAQLRLKSVPERANKGFFIYFVPDEELTLRGDLRAGGENYMFEVGGSAYYQDLARVREFTRPYHEEFAAAARAFSEGTDAGEDGAVLLKERLRADREIGERYGRVCEAYVMSHPESEAAYSLVNLNDKWGIAAIENMAPEVRNGRFARKIAQDLKVMQMIALKRMAANSRPKSMLAEGRQMPPFRLRTPEGGEFSSDSLRGKYTVLDFWGSWCVWCVRGIPKMKKCYERYSDRLNMVSIACSDSENGWRGALKKHRMPWTQVISDDRTVEAAYNVRSYPTKVVIDPDGKVLRAFKGEGADFYDYIEELLGE